jgi:hypothetical protein
VLRRSKIHTRVVESIESIIEIKLTYMGRPDAIYPKAMLLIHIPEKKSGR